MSAFDITSENLLGVLALQAHVCSFFKQAYAQRQLSHAYLFIGNYGLGISEALDELAKMLLCPHGGDECACCRRIMHKSHPDVHQFYPQGAQGYVVEQIHDLLDVVHRAPIQAKRKLIVIHEAQSLGASCANALLKTLEEPPASVYFVLVSTSAAQVLQTISSRCQHIPFTFINQAQAAKLVQQAAASTPEQARWALYIKQSPKAAIDFLRSSSKMNIRSKIMHMFAIMPDADSWDLIELADELCVLIQIPLDQKTDEQQADLERSQDFLSAGARKKMQAAHKRQLSRAQQISVEEIIDISASLLRDAMFFSEGSHAEIMNQDAVNICDCLAARASTDAMLAALACADHAKQQMRAHVSAQLVLEAFFLNVHRALIAGR